MSVTINSIENKLIDALRKNPATASYKGGILTEDEALARIAAGTLSCPAVVVVYGGAREAGIIAGGTGAGAQLKRPGSWEITVLDNSYRGSQDAQGAPPHTNPGAYRIVESVLQIVCFKNFGLPIKRFEYAGDELFTAAWDDNVVGYTLFFKTQWETTCTAD
jgi:hypothetical protein